MIVSSQIASWDFWLWASSRNILENRNEDWFIHSSESGKSGFWKRSISNKRSPKRRNASDPAKNLRFPSTSRQCPWFWTKWHCFLTWEVRFRKGRSVLELVNGSHHSFIGALPVELASTCCSTRCLQQYRQLPVPWNEPKKHKQTAP